MKKITCLILLLLLLVVLLPSGLTTCVSEETSSPITEVIGPVYGGTLRMIAGSGPQMLGYPAMMGPEDVIGILPGVEKLLDASADRDKGNGLEPVLAESYEEDFNNNRLIFHIRPGVTFHDGSPLNADTVIWNFQQLIDSGALQYSDYWRGIRKIDDLTVEIAYSEYTNQLLYSWSFTSIYSRTAWEEASGGDLQKGIDWARTHCVGTGPFILNEYVRDSHLTWTKNPNYWKDGLPYLDGIDVRIIPDSTTAEMTMKAGQADIWQGIWRGAEDDGYELLISRTSLIINIWPNTADPDSKWNDIRLREALEYAIDKPAIVNAFGAEAFAVATMLSVPGEWGYDPDYPAREYDPEKARQLVIDAGYPDGLDAKMLVRAGSDGNNMGTALKRYLDDVGIRIDLDMADPGRFFGTMFGDTPGPDLAVMYSGNDVSNYLVSYMRWFSTDPFANVSYLGHTVEQRKLDEQAKAIPDVPGQKAMTEKLVRYLTDNAMILPILYAPVVSVAAPYVHTDWLSRGAVCWHSEDTWMEPH